MALTTQLLIVVATVILQHVPVVIVKQSVSLHVLAGVPCVSVIVTQYVPVLTAFTCAPLLGPLMVPPLLVDQLYVVVPFVLPVAVSTFVSLGHIVLSPTMSALIIQFVQARHW